MQLAVQLAAQPAVQPCNWPKPKKASTSCLYNAQGWLYGGPLVPLSSLAGAVSCTPGPPAEFDGLLLDAYRRAGVVGATLDDDVKAVVHGLHFVEDKVKGTGMALYHKVHPPHHVDDHADYKVTSPRR